MLLFYVRHADPIYDPDSITPFGERQAEAVAKRLALYGIDKIFASTSNRAILTATPTSELTKKKITTLDFCNEAHAWNYFSAEDKFKNRTWIFNIREFEEQLVGKEVQSLGDEWYNYKGFEGYHFKEGVEFVNRGVDEFLKSLGYEHDREKHIYNVISKNEERVALFAHQGFGLAFLSSVLDIPYPQMSTHFDIGTTGVTVINFSNKKEYTVPKVFQLSNDSHIYREGLPTIYNGGYRF